MDAPLSTHFQLMMENVKHSDFLTYVKEYFGLLKSGIAGTSTAGLKPEFRYTDAAVLENKGFPKQEILFRLLSTALGLSASFAFSYFAIKWLVNAMDPTYKQKKEAQERAEKLMKRIGVPDVKLSEFELCIASNLVDPLSMVVSWEDIGGLDDTISEIMETVILPFRRQDLFSGSSLIQPPKGVLLYGPPGCGKTMIAKATAKAAGARFINLQVASLFDKWYGESQKRAAAVFSLALKLQPTIIFIDEIDSFLRSRTSTDHEATAMVKTQFMSFWDGLITDPKCQIVIMGATNRPQDVDAAILRRMPSMFHIGLPHNHGNMGILDHYEVPENTDGNFKAKCKYCPALISGQLRSTGNFHTHMKNAAQRLNIIKIILEEEPVDDHVELEQISSKTEGFCGSDLRELCRNAAIYRIREHISSDENEVEGPILLRDINSEDFEQALHKMKLGRKGTAWTLMSQQADLD